MENELTTQTQPESTEIATPTNGGIMELKQLWKMADIFSRSKVFGNITTEATFLKLCVAKDLGLPLTVAMREVNVIQGNASLSANLIAAMIRKSPRYDYKVLESDEKVCRIQFFDYKHNSQGLSEFTWEDAKNTQVFENGKRIALSDKWNFKSFPKAMLFARAITAGARKYCPDIGMGGLYYYEELPDGSIETEIPADKEMVVIEKPVELPPTIEEKPAPKKKANDMPAVIDSRRKEVSELQKKLKESAPGFKVENEFPELTTDIKALLDDKKWGHAEIALDTLVIQLTILDLQNEVIESDSPFDFWEVYGDDMREIELNIEDGDYRKAYALSDNLVNAVKADIGMSKE